MLLRRFFLSQLRRVTWWLLAEPVELIFKMIKDIAKNVKLNNKGIYLKGLTHPSTQVTQSLWGYIYMFKKEKIIRQKLDFNVFFFTQDISGSAFTSSLSLASHRLSFCSQKVHWGLQCWITKSLGSYPYWIMLKVVAGKSLALILFLCNFSFLFFWFFFFFVLFQAKRERESQGEQSLIFTIKQEGLFVGNFIFVFYQ